MIAMFVRTKNFQNKDGTKRIYLQIVKNVWENGKSRQKVVCTLGRLKDLRKGAVDSLLKSLSRFSERLEVIEIRKDISAREDKEYGAPLIFRRIFKLLGLDKILNTCLASHNHIFSVKEAIFAMILNRILSPASKLRVYEWLDEVYNPILMVLNFTIFTGHLIFWMSTRKKLKIASLIMLGIFST